MTNEHNDRPGSLVVERDEPIVAIPLIEDGREVVRYTVDDSGSETPQTSDTRPETVRDALSLAGAWSDRDWDETIDALDRIRHESQPTPPIELQGLSRSLHSKPTDTPQP